MAHLYNPLFCKLILVFQRNLLADFKYQLSFHDKRLISEISIFSQIHIFANNILL